MIREYISAAMAKAEYEILCDDGSFYGEIPGIQGVWANNDTLEECRTELEEVLEVWLLAGFWFQHDLPIVDGIDINVKVTV